MVIGYDHRFGHNRSEGFEDYVCYGKEIGIEVIRAQAYTSDIEIGTTRNIPVSSSLIRKLLHEGEVKRHNNRAISHLPTRQEMSPNALRP